MKKMLLILFLVPFACVAMEGQGDQTSSNAVAPESPRTLCRKRIAVIENELKEFQEIRGPVKPLNGYVCTWNIDPATHAGVVEYTKIMAGYLSYNLLKHNLEQDLFNTQLKLAELEKAAQKN